MLFPLLLTMLALTVPGHCQLRKTYTRNDSFLSVAAWQIDPEGYISFRFTTYLLDATLLYMEGSSGASLHLQLRNGSAYLAISDENNAITELSLMQRLNDNLFKGISVTRTVDTITLTANEESSNMSFAGSFSAQPPLYIAGVPSSAANLTYPEAANGSHFIGCMRTFVVGNGSSSSTEAFNNSLILEEGPGVDNNCVKRCSTITTECSGGECIEFYGTSFGCNCAKVFEGEGDRCTNASVPLLLDGTSHSCYTVPLLDSPYQEDETIAVFFHNLIPSNAMLVNGQKESTRFSLFLRDRAVHYRQTVNGMEVAALTINDTSVVVPGAILLLVRSASTVTLAVGSGNDSVSDFSLIASLRFTRLCVGGGGVELLPLYSSEIQVHYNLYALTMDGAQFDQQMVAKVDTVHLTTSLAQIDLQLFPITSRTTRFSFRADQEGILLHGEKDSQTYLRVAFNDSIVSMVISIAGVSDVALCNVAVNDRLWHDINMEVDPIQSGVDTPRRIRLAIDTTDCMAVTAPTGFEQLDNASIILGGSAGGVTGYQGCVGDIRFGLSQGTIDLRAAVGGEVTTEGCTACGVQPCGNGGTCEDNGLRSSFTCVCPPPYFGPLCGMMSSSSSMMPSSSSMMPSSSSMMSSSSVAMTTTVFSTTSSVAMTTTMVSSPASTTMVPMPTSTPATTTSLLTATVGIMQSPIEPGSDDSNVGALIGIILAIVVGLLLILLIILIVIVVIRNRNNRQGFYHTDEGKGGDEMILKYSASLRSISRPDSSTLNTHNNGGTAKKDEYFI